MEQRAYIGFYKFSVTDYLDRCEQVKKSILKAIKSLG